jgi:hypothetical protein
MSTELSAIGRGGRGGVFIVNDKSSGENTSGRVSWDPGPLIHIPAGSHIYYSTQAPISSLPPPPTPSPPSRLLQAVSFKTVGYKSGNVEKREEFKFDGFPIGSILISRVCFNAI